MSNLEHHSTGTPSVVNMIHLLLFETLCTSAEEPAQTGPHLRLTLFARSHDQYVLKWCSKRLVIKNWQKKQNVNKNKKRNTHGKDRTCDFRETVMSSTACVIQV